MEDTDQGSRVYPSIVSSNGRLISADGLFGRIMGSTVARKSGLALGLPGSGDRSSWVSFMVD